MAVHALLNSGSGVTSISETLARQLQREAREPITQPFQGRARVQTSFGEVRAVEQQTVPLHLTLMTPWGNVRF